MSRTLRSTRFADFLIQGDAQDRQRAQWRGRIRLPCSMDPTPTFASPLLIKRDRSASRRPVHWCLRALRVQHSCAPESLSLTKPFMPRIPWPLCLRVDLAAVPLHLLTVRRRCAASAHSVPVPSARSRRRTRWFVHEPTAWFKSKPTGAAIHHCPQKSPQNVEGGDETAFSTPSRNETTAAAFAALLPFGVRKLSRGIGSIARPAARDCGRQPAWMMAESTRHLAKALFPLKAIFAWNEGADD